MRRLRLTPRRIAVVLAATVGISAGVAYAATLSVTSWHLWAGSQTLTKATCTLTGTAQTTDAQVVQVSDSGAVFRAVAVRLEDFRTALLRLALAGRFFLTELLFMEQLYSIQISSGAKNIVPKCDV